MAKTTFDNMLDNMRQLHEHNGPYYDHWLEKFSEAMEKKGPGLAKQYHQQEWLQGIQSFIEPLQWRKRGHSERS